MYSSVLKWSSFLFLLSLSHCEKDVYTDSFAVQVVGGMRAAQKVASTHGFRVVRQIPGPENLFHFEHSDVKGRTKRRAENLEQKLLSEPNVLHAEHQRLLIRTKREIIHDKQSELDINYNIDKDTYQRYNTNSQRIRNKREIIHDKQRELDINYNIDKKLYQRYNTEDRRLNNRDEIPGSELEDMDFNDPYYPDQWYLVNRGQSGGQPGYDVNVLPVWHKGITGQGVTVCILDDGIDHTHPDLAVNYDPEASADLNDKMDNDPMPDTNNADNSHGTRCAGEVAAAANNSICGVGIAYNAKIGGVRMLDGPVTDMLEAEALNFNNQKIDIYSSSWGPRDDGATIEMPGKLCQDALKRGTEEGRGGKGSIFVWATGNGGMNQDDCSCDGYVSNIHTLSIGSIGDSGKSTYYSEVCPSTMAVIFTGGSNKPPGEKGYKNPKVKIVTTDLDHGCTLEFQGTSSAAPLAAGCIALLLEANPELTWRDVQHIVVETARIPNDKEDGWMVNGAGHHVNHRFGFGALDCGEMVEAGQDWKTVPPQHSCEVPAKNKKQHISQASSFTQSLTTDGCRHKEGMRIDHLEHVQVSIVLDNSKRGDISIVLTSPSGTRSEILSIRPNDENSEQIDFTFMTVHNWGEDPEGTWHLTVTDNQPDGYEPANQGMLHEWSLTLWGYAEIDDTRESTEEGGKRDTNGHGDSAAYEPGEREIKHMFAEEEEESNTVDIDPLVKDLDDAEMIQDDKELQETYKSLKMLYDELEHEEKEADTTFDRLKEKKYQKNTLLKSKKKKNEIYSASSQKKTLSQKIDDELNGMSNPLENSPVDSQENLEEDSNEIIEMIDRILEEFENL